MPQYRGHHAGWPIYAPPAPSSLATPMPPLAPRMGRPVQLPPCSVEERNHREQTWPAASFALQIPPVSNIIYDVRFPPSTLRSSLDSPFRISSSSDLDVPLSPSGLRPPAIHLVSKDFPWTISVHERTRGAGITCLDTVCALYDALQMPLTDTEWGFCSGELRGQITRAWKRRRRRTEEAVAPLKRVDILGLRCKLRGFCRDEDFVAQRLFPGTSSRAVPPPDTWVVCFMQ